MASGPSTSWQIDGETKETVIDINFLGSKITADGDCRHGMKRLWLLGRKATTNLDSILKSRDITLPTNFCAVENMVFPKGKNSSFRIDFRKTKGNPSWIFIGRTDAEAEAPILWPPDVKNWLIRKDPDAGKDWRQEEKGTMEDMMVRWHHQLNGHEFEQDPRDGEGAVHGITKSWTWLRDWTTKRSFCSS